jgi:hypothetical protein
MKDQVKSEVNEKINQLVRSTSMEGRIIGEINDICFQNKPLAKDISDILVGRALQEKSGINKLKILYVIDSIIKNMGAEFIRFLSPHLFRIFEETYILSDEEGKISLFKLYYAWKYFIDVNILESLSSRFNFNETKRILMRDRPELIEKYDKFNEGVRDNILREKEREKQMKVSVQNYQTSVPLQPPKKPFGDTSLKDLVDNRSRKKKTSGDLFSSQSSSPRVSVESSDDERRKRKTQMHRAQDKREDRSSEDKRKKQAIENKRVSQFADEIDIDDFQIKKKKVTLDEKEKDGSRFPYSSTCIKNKNLNLKLLKFNKFIANQTQEPIIPTIQSIQEKAQQPLPNTNLLFNTIPILMNPQFATLLNQIYTNVNPMTGGLGAVPGMSMNPVPLTQPREKEKDSEIILPTPASLHQAFTNLDTFVNRSTSQINPSNPQFFSSVSKFFYESLNESNPLHDLMRDFNLKNKFDILKIRDTSKESYQEILKKSVEALSTDLKNLCSICGFRTKYYNKFVEHLDIHFHINYIKRNSQKKVLYRKESSDKSSWLRCNEDSAKSAGSYTLNSVLFYQNDADHFMSNKKDQKGEETVEDNEQLIFPVQPGQEIKCVYCSEEFKRKYVNKFHFWFYVNAVKLNKEDLASIGVDQEIFNKWLSNDFNNSESLVHENCLEEFLKMVKSRENINFNKSNDHNHLDNQYLREKRFR